MHSPPPPDGARSPLEAIHGAAGDALIELLHRVQEARGWLDRDSLRQVARQLRLPLSHVLGVASFYHLFLLQRPTPHRCAVCLGTACFVRGALQLARQLEGRLGLAVDGPEGDGRWSLQRVGCLGACGQAPVLVVDGRLLSHVPLQASQLEARLRAAGLPEVSPAESRPGDPQPRARASDPQP